MIRKLGKIIFESEKPKIKMAVIGHLF